MVLGRAILGGGRLHPDPSVGGASRFDPQQYAATVATARAGGATRLYGSLVPTQLRRLVDLGDVGLGALRSLDAVLSGAAATPPDLAEVLRDNGVRLLTSYGMSETSGGCAYDGVPLPGLSFRTDTPDGRSLGRLQVTGPSVAAGYRLHPDDPAIRAGTVFTADVGRIADDGTVVVVGRADEGVQGGGVNVALPAVADALRTRDEVADACVVSVPDREWGARIVAFVVPAGRAATPATGQAAPDGATLQAAVREQLGPAAVPRTVLSLAGIPLLATGKPDRRALLALVPPR
jgi:O-succinylbenzoic acid--CoA ligase